MKRLSFFVLFTLSILILRAQEQKITITGKPIVTLFANYHTGLGHANSSSGFELDRAYLGYQFKLTENFGGKVIFDIGETNLKGADLERVAYVKNAMLSWTPGNFTLDFGLVKTEQFSLQESFWGYRYILKSFDDEYKFGPSADMGIIGKYRFNDYISADLSFTNGEGYKKINKDNNYRYGAGVTLTPVTDLTFRIYGDIYTGNSDSTENQSNLSLFAGYRHKLFRIGAEYNKLWNATFTEGNNKDGYSVYTSVNAGKKFTVFGRYDYLHSQEEQFRETDGQRILAGVQYTPIRFLKLSPNFRNWNPQNGKAESFIYLNLEFKL
ncbi:hypothetical protein [Culturomica sp.]|jgi:hypothetical protein|uniref:hypothetical protein n=1 Tax=Culturomica sp. TaxID=1926652 RepID=UPI000338B323|nr:hypothetical protein [Culturomica sp.]CCZ06994.1 uncharacterized protein BN783_02612 [Odoribacter sp. CAG:788]HBO27435.1 hypothetical protein [Culturomica sp.]